MTKEKRTALAEVRKAISERLGNFSFSEEMLSTLSVFQLVNILMLVSGARNYIGQFSHTIYSLQEIFGADAIWDRPLVEAKEVEPKQAEPEKEVVH